MLLFIINFLCLLNLLSIADTIFVQVHNVNYIWIYLIQWSRGEGRWLPISTGRYGKDSNHVNTGHPNQAISLLSSILLIIEANSFSWKCAHLWASSFKCVTIDACADYYCQLNKLCGQIGGYFSSSAIFVHLVKTLWLWMSVIFLVDSIRSRNIFNFFVFLGNQEWRRFRYSSILRGRRKVSSGPKYPFNCQPNAYRRWNYICCFGPGKSLYGTFMNQYLFHREKKLWHQWTINDTKWTKTESCL